jgi:hypothetical protein
LICFAASAAAGCVEYIRGQQQGCCKEEFLVPTSRAVSRSPGAMERCHGLSATAAIRKGITCALSGGSAGSEHTRTDGMHRQQPGTAVCSTVHTLCAALSTLQSSCRCAVVVHVSLHWLLALSAPSPTGVWGAQAGSPTLGTSFGIHIAGPTPTMTGSGWCQTLHKCRQEHQGPIG